MVALDEVQAEVERRGLSCRGQHLPVVDVEHVGPHVDARITASELLGVHPVRGRHASVEQTRRGEDERPRAERGDPRARVVRRAQRREQSRVRRPVELIGGRDHHSVDPGELCESARGEPGEPRRR